jgi:hypothetical protein
MNLSRYDVDQLRNKRLLRWRKVAGKVRILEADIRAYYSWQEQFAPGEEMTPPPVDFWPELSARR